MSGFQPKRLIFTSELMHLVKRERQYSSPLLHRLTLIDGSEGEALRAQIERVASAVPADKHKPVLRPIVGKKSSDDQVENALGTLFLAKTLEDLGWEVEHEPKEAGGTPDLQIRKGDTSYLVEVRRVAGPLQGLFSQDILRLRDALNGINTQTPIEILDARVSGQSTLKPFVRYIKELLAAPRRDEVQVFDHNGVYVCFKFDQDLGFEVPVFGGWTSRDVGGQSFNDIRTAIHEKLGRYKVPLVVALDLRNLSRPFEDVEDVVLGRNVVKVPIRMGQGDVGAPVRMARADDSIFAEVGRDGERARTRLQALIPFLLGSTEGKLYSLQARVIANPAQSSFPQFQEFDPIPRLVVTEKTVKGVAMNYMVGSTRLFCQADLAFWSHTP